MKCKERGCNLNLEFALLQGKNLAFPKYPGEIRLVGCCPKCDDWARFQIDVGFPMAALRFLEARGAKKERSRIFKLSRELATGTPRRGTWLDGRQRIRPREFVDVHTLQCEVNSKRRRK